MKYLGVDYGAKRVGLAVSDANGSIAFPLETVDTAAALTRIIQLVQEKGLKTIIVGDTLFHGGVENPVTREAQEFCDRLARETGLPVSRASEAWSSVEASRFAPKGSEHDDAAAAAIILQRFLDSHPSA